MTPKFGFRTSCLTGWTAERAAGELARLGYDCLELCLEPADVRPESLDEAHCAALCETFAGLGIAVASLSYHGDAEAPADRLLNQERAIGAAARLGAGILVINSERTVDRDRQWPELVSHLKKLCRLAEDAGVDLAVEPEPLLVVDSSEDMIKLLQAVDSPRLRVNFDIGHAQVTDDDPAASICRLGSAIVHVHLEDIQNRVHRHLMFGEGEMDFAAIRRALADIGYQGPYVADLFGQPDPPAAAESALAMMRQLFG
jgi:sugar phosphate isomerase/epimerase